MDLLLAIVIWIPTCITVGACFVVRERRLRAVELAREERLRLTDQSTVAVRIAEMDHERLMIGDGK